MMASDWERVMETTRMGAFILKWDDGPDGSYVGPKGAAAPKGLASDSEEARVPPRYVAEMCRRDLLPPAHLGGISRRKTCSRS